MDENNQYGQAMTKPLSYGCIKKQEHVPCMTEFNKILDKISHDNNIGHLLIVDIKFHNVNPKRILFNDPLKKKMLVDRILVKKAMRNVLLGI